MDLLQLLKFLPALLGAVWALWLFFKKDLLSKGPLQVITYFIGVVISLWIIGWLVDTFLFRWVAERLVAAQQSQDIQAIEQISQDILQSAFGTPVAPQPTIYVPGATPTPPGQPSPAASPQPILAPDQSRQAAPGERVHTVSAGETLCRIATQYGVTVQAIQQRNGLTDPNRISVGQQLIIPGQ